MKTQRVLAALFGTGVVAFSVVATGAPRDIAQNDPGTYLGDCDGNSACATGLYCYSFKQFGPHCTKTCTNDADCPAPSRGCTPQHQCGMPNR
jgi:hypothetical protein